MVLSRGIYAIRLFRSGVYDYMVPRIRDLSSRDHWSKAARNPLL